MVKYTKEDIAEEARKWLAREVTRDNLTKKEWNAMKRRINRAGFKRPSSDYLASSIGVTKEEWKKRRNTIAREIYARQKKKKQNDQPVD